MRKAIVVAAAALGLGALVLTNTPIVARAQVGAAAPVTAPVVAPAGGRHAAGGKRLQKLSTDLGLTDAQKAQMKPLLKDAAQQSKAVRQDTTLSPADKKAKLKSIREGLKSQMLPLLTPDQKVKLSTMRSKGEKKAKNV